MLPKNVRLTGRNPLAYLGVDPTTPPLLLVEKRSPTANDYSNVNIGAIWVVSEDNTQTYEYWVLVNIDSGAAHWVQLYPGASGGATSIPADVGTATVASGVLKIFGGENITTYGSGNEIDVQLDDSVSINTALTVKALGAGVILSDANGRFSSTDGNDGMVLIGNTNGAPEWAQITAGANVSISNGPNSITISASGGGGGGDLTFAGNTGTALANAGSITISGDGSVVSTTASGSGATATVTISAVSNPSFSSLTTDNITVTGTPTFSNLSDGILNITSGVVSSTSSSTNGAVLIASDVGPALWKTLSPGSGITITNSPNKILISSSGGGGSGVTFTGTSGTTNATSTLKILGDGSNITTAASGSGATSQVAITLASTPTFTSLTTTNLTVPGTLTLSNITSGILKVSGTGVVSGLTPSANGVLIGTSTGGVNWGTISGGGTVSVTTTPTGITITGSTSSVTWAKVTTLFSGLPIRGLCVGNGYWLAVTDGNMAYTSNPVGTWTSAAYSTAPQIRCCAYASNYFVVPHVTDTGVVGVYYSKSPASGFSRSTVSTSYLRTNTPPTGVGYSGYGWSVAGVVLYSGVYIPAFVYSTNLTSWSAGQGSTDWNSMGGKTFLGWEGIGNTTYALISNGTLYSGVPSASTSWSLTDTYVDTNVTKTYELNKVMRSFPGSFFTTTNTANTIYGKGYLNTTQKAFTVPVPGGIKVTSFDGNQWMVGGTALYKTTDLSSFTPLSVSGGTIGTGGITAMANSNGTWVAGDATGQIWVLVE